jgi:hypothetical protein
MINRNHSVLVLLIASCTLLFISSLVFTYPSLKNLIQPNTQIHAGIPTPSISKVGVYKSKSMGGIAFYNQKLANTYPEALKIFSEEKKSRYLQGCPGNPCQNVEIVSAKAQNLTDINNKPSLHTLYIISVQDKNTKILVQAVSDAIDDQGILYNINYGSD